MSLNFSVPIFFEGAAIPRGKRAPSVTYFTEDIDVSIPVVDPADAPVAVSWQEIGNGARQQRPRHSLWLDGHHFFSNTLKPFADEKLAEEFIRGFLVDRDDKLTGGGAYLAYLAARRRDGSTPVHYDQDRHLLIDDRGRNAQLNALSVLIDRLCLIGDRLYFKGRDPAYGVNRSHLNRPGQRYSYYLRAADHNSGSISTRSFSLNDFEAVREFSAGARRLSGRYEVDIFMPETLTVDHDASALLDVALFVLKQARRQYASTYSSTGGCWTPETQEPLMALQRLLPSLGSDHAIHDFPSDLDFDGIAVAIENIYPYLWVDNIDNKGMRPDLKYVEQVVNSWGDRNLIAEPDGFRV